MLTVHKILIVVGCLLMIAAENTVGATLKLDESSLGTKLPKPLSDVTASLGDNGLIYIAGGCDSSYGSQWDEDSFQCKSVSNSFYEFDPETKVFTALPDMPDPRFRHEAVVINNQIWLVGGRDEFDNVVGTIDVYDIGGGRWRTFDDLYYKYWVSDLGGFKAHGRAYFVGGFSQDYQAVGRVFSIDPVASWMTGTLHIIRHENLVNRRGDIGVAVNANETFAYVSGGSTDSNSFCAPLNSVESYNLNTREWTEMAPLRQGRTGKTVYELHDRLVALGGTQRIQETCDETFVDPSEMQLPVYEIEAFDDGAGRWVVVDNLADYRYRSTSVVYNDKIYSFGGQSVFFAACMCHPTVDDVQIYIQGDQDVDSDSGTISVEKEAPELDPLEGDGNDGDGNDGDTAPGGGYQRDSIDGLQASSGANDSTVTIFLTASMGVLAASFL